MASKFVTWTLFPYIMNLCFVSLLGNKKPCCFQSKFRAKLLIFGGYISEGKLVKKEYQSNYFYDYEQQKSRNDYSIPNKYQYYRFLTDHKTNITYSWYDVKNCTVESEALIMPSNCIPDEAVFQYHTVIGTVNTASWAVHDTNGTRLITVTDDQFCNMVMEQFYRSHPFENIDATAFTTMMTDFADLPVEAFDLPESCLKEAARFKSQTILSAD